MRSMEKMDEVYPLLTDAQLVDTTYAFQEDLTRSLSGQSSSLPCILNPVSRIIPRQGFGVAVSLGGTNGYASAFRVSENKRITFLNRIFFPLPVRSTKESFFQLIAAHVLAAAGNRKQPFPIGISFAYLLKPVLHHGFVDGELLSMSKERDISGLVGKRMGQEFHRHLIQHHQMDTTVALANDAICLLIGGNGGDIAGVLGTGLNFAYWERCVNVAPQKLRELDGFSLPEVAVNKK